MASRLERSSFGEWLWTVDRWLLGGVGLLMLCGILLGLAGSPPVAERIGLPTFHFVNRQVIYLVPAIATLLLASFLSPRHVRRAGLVIFLLGLAGVAATLVVGADIKGARRWLQIGPLGIQPSEFLKPAFVIIAAWAFSEGARRKDMPGTWIAVLLLLGTVAPLVLQPDVGQTTLLIACWCTLFFLAGLHWLWVVGLAGAGGLLALLAYKLFPHVTARVNHFLEKGSGDTFQVDTALESFTAGGWLGKGPGEGTIKRILPDSHTDFIFAVTGEEFGIIACMGLMSLFAFIVLRGLYLAQKNEDPFCRLAAAGLVTLFGLQSTINMAVNLNLIPPKGMTLPFVSYGGSSLISLALGMGFLLAVTRRRPRAEILDRIIEPERRGFAAQAPLAGATV
ncbi:MAG: putative lipid II flippase FtsW [Beijerinckiaceae bacterium]|nr:putative lipid II flippase FtsW [Beijerinckiaceae bacterium]